MAALLFRTCLKRSISKNFFCDSLGSDRTWKLNTALVEVNCLKCNCYHSTPILLKRRKTQEQRQKMILEKELEIMNPKQKKDLPTIEIWKNMTVKELAAAAGRPVHDVLDALFFIDKESFYEYDSIFEDPVIMYETVRKLGAKFKVIQSPKRKQAEENEEGKDVVKRPPPDPSVLIKRRPVITIMGHVDHGKTTLLDTIRNSSVVDTEFGGITQHIGAFNVTLDNGEKMTFLDTPGHAAFHAMRARGANVTDIVVLIVAADDGVMEQTVQSIEMAKSANVPMIIAINKIDKPDADIKRTHQMLAEQGIHVEALGGDIQSVNISALKGTNLDHLMDAIAAQAEIMDLKGDPSGLVEGVVIEATTDVHRGKLATALIQRGTLRKGDVLVSGLAWAKVRAMFDHSGTIVNQAGLSDAVQIIGWRELPISGNEILEVESEREAHKVMKFRQAKLGEQKSIDQKIVADQKNEEHLIEYHKMVQKKRILGVRKLRREGLRTKELVEDNFPKVDIIIKGDVVGSVEALLDVIDTYCDEKRCRLSLVHYGVGPVTDTDVELARTFDAIIYCFNTKVPSKVLREIQGKGVTVRQHNVIYRLIDDLKNEINEQLPTIEVEEQIGKAKVLQEFEINEKRKKVKIAGCRCEEGTIKKSALFKVVRDGEVIYNGTASSLKHLKEEVDTIKVNTECGVKLDKFDIEFKPGDEIICYKMVNKEQKTDWNPGF